jgi:hypothetical protein
MEKATTSIGSTKRHGIRMVLVAAVAGAGLGIGAVSLPMGAQSDAVALQPVSLPSPEASAASSSDGPTSPGDAAPAPSSTPRSDTTPSEPAPVPRSTDTTASGSDGVVARAAAERAALAYVGEGRVTWVSQEDDYGAVWEIEVTLPNGHEVDVYIDAAGRVVHTS